MPYRTVPLVNEQIYHIYNRGVEKRDIFLQPRDYQRFKKTLHYYQFLGPKPSFSKFTKAQSNTFDPTKNEQLVEIIAYCLMPNHFHFLIRQIKDNGLSLFMSQLGNSYTKYFNTKYTRVGPLLQGAFKAVLIESEEQFIHVSRYIHLNPIVSGIIKPNDNYLWSSYSEYLGIPLLCSPKTVLDLFPSKQAYRKFVEDQIDYGMTLEFFKHQLIDEH